MSSIFDLLLAEALAAGIARAAASREEPAPENFFVLPPDEEVNKIEHFMFSSVLD